MGKQINYWPGYEDFLQIAEASLDCGCVIIRYAAGRELVYGRTSDIVTADWYRYFFYVPEDYFTVLKKRFHRYPSNKPVSFSLENQMMEAFPMIWSCGTNPKSRESEKLTVLLDPIQ